MSFLDLLTCSIVESDERRLLRESGDFRKLLAHDLTRMVGVDVAGTPAPQVLPAGPPSEPPPVQPRTPGTAPIQPPSGANAESPTLPAQPISQPPVGVESEEIDPFPVGKSAGMQRELDALAATPAKSRKPRWREIIENMLYEGSQAARRVSEASVRSGRPVDEYGLASVAGGFGGGGAAAAINPAVNAERKRVARMNDLAGLIEQQLKVEKQQAARMQQEQELQLRAREVGVRSRQVDATAENQRERTRRMNKPKAQVIGGVLYDTEWDEANEKWGPLAPQQHDGKVIQDASKKPNEAGLLPWQIETSKRWGADRESRERIAANNNKFRGEENEKNRRERQEQFAGRMKLGWATYQQRVSEAAQRAEQAAARDRAAGVRTAVSYAAAKAQAEKKNIDFPDYADILSEAGIEITDK